MLHGTVNVTFLIWPLLSRFLHSRTFDKPSIKDITFHALYQYRMNFFSKSFIHDQCCKMFHDSYIEGVGLSK